MSEKIIYLNKQFYDQLFEIISSVCKRKYIGSQSAEGKILCKLKGKFECNKYSCNEIEKIEAIIKKNSDEYDKKLEKSLKSGRRKLKYRIKNHPDYPKNRN